MNKEKMSRPLDKEEEVPSGPLSTAGGGFEPPSKCWGVGQVQGRVAVLYWLAIWL